MSLLLGRAPRGGPGSPLGSVLPWAGRKKAGCDTTLDAPGKGPAGVVLEQEPERPTGLQAAWERQVGLTFSSGFFELCPAWERALPATDLEVLLFLPSLRIFEALRATPGLVCFLLAIPISPFAFLLARPPCREKAPEVGVVEHLLRLADEEAGVGRGDLGEAAGMTDLQPVEGEGGARPGNPGRLTPRTLPKGILSRKGPHFTGNSVSVMV